MVIKIIATETMPRVLIVSDFKDPNSILHLLCERVKNEIIVRVTRHQSIGSEKNIAMD